MSKLINTLLLVVLGLALGAGTMIYMVWKTSEKIIAKSVAAKASELAAKKIDKPWDFWTIEMENLATDLKEEKLRLRQREEAMVAREARMAVEQQELEKTRMQIENLRSAIDQRLIEVTEGETSNLKRLAQSYTALSAKSTVAIFKEMDDTTCVKLLAMMKPETVATVLEEMTRQAAADPNLAKRAATLSEKLRLIKVTKPATSG
ncbi:MAG: hypothetical protein WC378_10270 [Opitutaceae bacterium]|jgi:flagellar motility protein MotE (MotC chaperone)